MLGDLKLIVGLTMESQTGVMMVIKILKMCQIIIDLIISISKHVRNLLERRCKPYEFGKPRFAQNC